MWATVELREIRVFLAIAEELHFGRAAERLSITQSRASQSLRILERKLGQELVHRTSRRVALTVAGERFRAAVQPAYANLAATLEQASGDAEAILGGLVIGLPGAVPQSTALIEVIRRFEERHPGCQVEVKELALSDRLEPLRRGDVDVMVSHVPFEAPDLEAGPALPPEPRALAVAADHPLADRAAVTSEEIADYEVADTTGLLPPELEGVLIPGQIGVGEADEAPPPATPRLERVGDDGRPRSDRPPSLRRPVRASEHPHRADRRHAALGEWPCRATRRAPAENPRLPRRRRRVAGAALTGDR